MEEDLKLAGEGRVPATDWNVPRTPEAYKKELEQLIAEAEDFITKTSPLLIFAKGEGKEFGLNEAEVGDLAERAERMKDELSRMRMDLEKFSDPAYVLQLRAILKKWRGVKGLKKETKAAIDLLDEEISKHGKIPSTLAGNIARKRDPSLFDQMGKSVEFSYIGKERKYIDRRGKSTYLSRNQMKIVCGLSHYLSTDPTIQGEIEKVRRYEADLRLANKDSGLLITRDINLKKICRDYYSTEGKSKYAKVKELYEELREIEQIRQVFFLPKKGEEGKIVRFATTFFSIAAEIGKLDEEGGIPEYIKLAFNPIFLFDIENAYFPMNKDCFLLWGKRGSGTETALFNVLFIDLMAKYPHKRMTAKNREKKIQKGEDLDPDNIFSYSQKLSLLRDKCVTDYESQKQYRNKFKTDIEKALVALRDSFKLITGWDINPNSSGAPVLTVYFNPDYNKQERG